MRRAGRAFSGPILLVLVLVAAAMVIKLPLEREAKGLARVVDGDSLHVDALEIRLMGMDAPELSQTCERAGFSFRCGEEARRILLSKINGGIVQCSLSGQDRYGRSLGRCAVKEEDLGAWMVAQGWAVAFGDYEEEEGSARAQKRGLWAMKFEEPSLWRQAHPRGE